MQKALSKHGFILILLALVTGFVIPQAAIPRLALSAHTIALLSGILLLGVSAIWPQLNLSEGQKKMVYWGWVYSGYANWLGILIGAYTGAGRMTPIASGGLTSTSLAEAVVAFLLISLSLAALVAAILSIWGVTRRA
jgi:hydroxylaminobenzene mutase